MTKILATGATGYIGGDAIYAIAHAHPEYEFTCLVRNSDKAASIAKDYASFKFVYGDLDSSELIEQEAGKADIVLNCADASHENSLKAIIRGLTSRDASRRNGFLIHTSGTGTIMHADVESSNHGNPSDRIYDDLSGLATVRSIPTTFAQRGAEELVLTASKDAGENGQRLRTTIVCPPCIYGTGRGSGNQRSQQIPELVRVTLEKGFAVTVGAGENRWSTVHVHDLSALFLKLVENAAAGESLAEWPGKPALWGEEGFFFAESGEVEWKEVAQCVVDEAKKAGYLKGNEVKQIAPKEANDLTPRGDNLWGCNSRSRAKRAREALEWKAEGKGLREVVKEQVEIEARALEVRTPHAKVAAGNA